MKSALLRFTVRFKRPCKQKREEGAKIRMLVIDIAPSSLCHHFIVARLSISERAGRERGRDNGMSQCEATI